MSTKRPAEYLIDQKTLQPIEKHPDLSKNQKATKEEISDRTILKVKRDQLVKEEKQQNQQKVEKQDVKKQQKDEKGILFTNLFNNNGQGLFGNIGLFGGPKTVEPPKINIFSPNLFNNTGITIPPNSSIFNFSNGNLPPKTASQQNQQDDEGDSAELQKGQNMEIDRSKSKCHYEYKEANKVLISGNANKFKKNNGDLIEMVQVILQEDPKNHLYYLIIRLPATKNTIFNGLVIPRKSQARILNNKHENLEIVVFIFQKQKPLEKNKIKLQFETSEIGKKFYDKIQEIINKKKQATDQKSDKNESKKESETKQDKNKEELKQKSD